MRSRAGIATGWWGIPGEPDFTKVHVMEYGQPACGSRVGDDMLFQWCAPGIFYPYLECEHCKKMTRAGKFDVEG